MHLWSCISERLLKMSVWVKKSQMHTQALEHDKWHHRNHKYKFEDMAFIHERFSEKSKNRDCFSPLMKMLHVFVFFHVYLTFLTTSKIIPR